PSTFLHFNDMLFSSSGFPSKSVIILEVVLLSTSPALRRNSNRCRRGARNFATLAASQCVSWRCPALHSHPMPACSKRCLHHHSQWPWERLPTRMQRRAPPDNPTDSG